MVLHACMHPLSTSPLQFIRQIENYRRCSGTYASPIFSFLSLLISKARNKTDRLSYHLTSLLLQHSAQACRPYTNCKVVSEQAGTCAGPVDPKFCPPSSYQAQSSIVNMPAKLQSLGHLEMHGVGTDSRRCLAMAYNPLKLRYCTLGLQSYDLLYST